LITGATIRVWLETASAVTRAGLESLLEGNGMVEMADSPPHADVILTDELPSDSEESHPIPVVALSDVRLTTRLTHRGIYAILPREARADQIVAALFAAAAGLIAIPVDVPSAMVPAASDAAMESLTRRELETLEMLAEGLSNKQIAARLNISEHTAKFHVNSILNKLGAGTRTEAVVRGLRRGLLKV